MTQVKTAEMDAELNTASIDGLLNPKPAKAMVLGGAPEKVSEKIRNAQKIIEEKRKVRVETQTMESFIRVFEQFLVNGIKIGESVNEIRSYTRSFSVHEFDSLLEYCGRLYRRTAFLCSLIPVASLSVMFIASPLLNEPQLFFLGVITLIVGGIVCGFLEDVGYVKSISCFFLYRKLKKLHGKETNQKIYEAIQSPPQEP